MNKLLAVVLIFAVSAGWIQSAQSQDSKGIPVEFFACNWQDGKGMADLKKVAANFSKWADSNDSGYSAWILTPQFHSANLGFEVGWLGSWPDSNAFGKSMDAWLSGGRELAGEFAKVVDCSISHETAASVVIDAPDGPPGNGLVMFSQCTLNEGVSPSQAIPAHRKAAAAMKELGSKGASWIFLPGMGTSAEGFDYWAVLAYQNYTDFGAAIEMYLNGGGREKVMAARSPVASCGSGTVFDAHLVRAGARP